MYGFVQYVLLGVTLVLTLVFTGLLVLLCVRTRSKGLITITAVLVYPPTLGLIQSYILRLYIDQWAVGGLSRWIPPMTIEEFSMLYKLVMRLLHDGLLVLGAFLLYRDWSNGTITWHRHKSSKIVNHA